MTMTREQAIQILSTRDWSGMLCGYTSGYTEALDMAVEALSSNAIQVVQCKDCKHRETDDCPMYRVEWFSIDEGYGAFEDDYIIHDYTTNNGYCHYGERKE